MAQIRITTACMQFGQHAGPTCAWLDALQLPLHVADVVQQVQVPAALKVHPVGRRPHAHQLHVLLYARSQSIECLQCNTHNGKDTDAASVLSRIYCMHARAGAKHISGLAGSIAEGLAVLQHLAVRVGEQQQRGTGIEAEGAVMHRLGPAASLYDGQQLALAPQLATHTSLRDVSVLVIRGCTG